MSFDKTEEKQSKEEIDDDIEKLEKLLAEKKKLKQKKDFEM